MNLMRIQNKIMISLAAVALAIFPASAANASTEGELDIQPSSPSPDSIEASELSVSEFKPQVNSLGGGYNVKVDHTHHP